MAASNLSAMWEWEQASVWEKENGIRLFKLPFLLFDTLDSVRMWLRIFCWINFFYEFL